MGSILSTKNVRIAPTDMPWRCRPQEKGSCCCLGPTIYFGHRSKQTRRLIIPKRLQIAGWQEGEANELCHTLSHSLAFRGPASLGRPAKLLGLQMPHSAPLPQVLFPPPPPPRLEPAEKAFSLGTVSGEWSLRPQGCNIIRMLLYLGTQRAFIFSVP